MVIVGHDETEVNVVTVIGDLHRRGLIIRPGPRSTGVLFKQDVGPSPIRAGAFRGRKLGIRKDRNPAPFREIAIQDNRVRCADDRVKFFSWFNVVAGMGGDCNQADCGRRE